MVKKTSKATTPETTSVVEEEPYAVPECVETSLRLARIFKAGQPLGSPRAIMLRSGLAFLFDPLAEENSVILVGVSENSANRGCDVTVVVSGEITLKNSFRAGMIYYAAAGGLLTCKLPVSGISVKMGIGLDADTMLVQMSEPLLLS